MSNDIDEPAELIEWLPEPAKVTAEDFEHFGPNAVQVRTLLSYVQKMSLFAIAVHLWADAKMTSPLVPNEWWEHSKEILDAVEKMSERAHYLDYALTEIPPPTGHESILGWEYTLRAEIMSDLIDDSTYGAATNALNVCRIVDRMLANPRYKDAPLGETFEQTLFLLPLITPQDVIEIGGIAASPEDVREVAIRLVRDGMPPAEALEAARRL